MQARVAQFKPGQARSGEVALCLPPKHCSQPLFSAAVLNQDLQAIVKLKGQTNVNSAYLWEIAQRCACSKGLVEGKGFKTHLHCVHKADACGNCGCAEDKGEDAEELGIALLLLPRHMHPKASLCVALRSLQQ